MNITYRRTLLVLLAVLLAFVITLTISSLCYSARASDVRARDEPTVDPAPVYSVTPQERELLARLVWNEAGTCSQACQEAVVSVVFNQLAAGYWGGTVTEVVTRPGVYVGGQARFLDAATPDARCYAAVDAVLLGGSTLPSSVRYFRADYGFESVWDSYETVLILDNVFFGRFTDPSIH